MLILLTILIMFVGSMFGIAAAVSRSRGERTAMFVIGLVSPLLVVSSFVFALFGSGEVVPCPGRLEEVEKEIDARRVRFFDAKPKTHFVAHTWQKRYCEHLSKQAQFIEEAVERVAA